MSEPWIYLPPDELMEFQRRKTAHQSKVLAEIAGMKIVANPDMKPDEFILGYPDGKGGMKPGAVKGKL